MDQRPVLDPAIIEKIKGYLSVLKQSGLVVDKAILFGSAAKGNQKPWSDYDLCIVSRQFGRNRFEERVRLMKLVPSGKERIEPHPYHPKDLREKYDPLAAEIRKNGIIIS